MEFTFEIMEHIGTIDTYGTGWSKELNLVNWNGIEKYDIRDWGPDHLHMSKGITLTADELESLTDILTNYATTGDPDYTICTNSGNVIAEVCHYSLI